MISFKWFLSMSNKIIKINYYTYEAVSVGVHPACKVHLNRKYYHSVFNTVNFHTIFKSCVTIISIYIIYRSDTIVNICVKIIFLSCSGVFIFKFDFILTIEQVQSFAMIGANSLKKGLLGSNCEYKT